jgi:hypothetical protein
MKYLVAAGAALLCAATAGAATPSSTPPAAGLYLCGGTTSGISKMRFGDGNTYGGENDTNGSYSFDAGSGWLTFTSGGLEGLYGVSFTDGDVGLTSERGQNHFYMTCQRKGD